VDPRVGLDAVEKTKIPNITYFTSMNRDVLRGGELGFLSPPLVNFVTIDGSVSLSLPWKKQSNSPAVLSSVVAIIVRSVVLPHYRIVCVSQYPVSRMKSFFIFKKPHDYSYIDFNVGRDRLSLSPPLPPVTTSP
jgi:hypothetical protein